MTTTLFACGAVFAQSSASYRAEENAFNSGGRPAGGATAASATYAVTLDALGDAVAGGRITSPMFGLTSGFGAAHPPAGEVQRLRFLDPVTLAWQPEPSAWSYNLYRGAIADLASGSYGACDEQAIPGTSTLDTDAVDPGDGFFYLVSAVSGLAEEGTLGFASGGAERIPALSCP